MMDTYSDEAIEFIHELATKDKLTVEEITDLLNGDQDKIKALYTIAKKRHYRPPAKSGKEIKRELPKELITITNLKHCYPCQITR